MNQQCKVCNEPAAGFHFGAFTCEGCKSFFGRSYNNLSSISECKNNGECVINKKNRTSCKACRLRKCLMVGMSKSGSRYGRRSNWFKIHCLLQEQQQQKVDSSPEKMEIREDFAPAVIDSSWLRWNQAQAAPPPTHAVFPFLPPLVGFHYDDNFNTRWVPNRLDHYHHSLSGTDLPPRPPSLTPPLDSPIDLSMKAPPSPISSPSSHSSHHDHHSSPPPSPDHIVPNKTPLDLTTRVIV